MLKTPSSLCDVLYKQAEQLPEKLAYRFLDNHGESESELSYQTLLNRASGVAQRLAGYQGRPVLLLLPPGIDYVVAFFGCMLAGVIAVPLYPPRKNASFDRIVSVVDDCGATVAITKRDVCEISHSVIHMDDWICIEACEEARSHLALNQSAEDLAFLQYTSGSVGKPKGVKISHGNMLNNLESIAHFSQQDSDSYGFSWLPPYHDMGLIGGILFPLYCGFTVDLMSPQAFVRSPMRWLECLSREQVTISVAPNFALDLCVENATSECLDRIDLSKLEVCFVGAEPVRSDTLQRFYKTFKGCGLRYNTFLPCYGLAESTLLVTSDTRDATPTTLLLDTDAFEEGHVVPAHIDGRVSSLVGCGATADIDQLVIVDPETERPCPPDRIGEIWASGPSVAVGYWNQNELTHHTFWAQPNGVETEARYLRTGDLGFVYEGQLFVVGRLDDMMVVHGRNYYPQDIERCAERCFEGLQPNGSACFLSDDADDLTLVMELRRSHYRTVDAAEVFVSVRQAVTEAFGIVVGRVVLLRPNGLLRTSSGKVQRKAIAKALAQGKVKVIDEWRLPKQKMERSDKLTETLDWLRAYAKTRINSQLIDERRTIPPYIVLDFGNRGLLGLEIPETYGGPGFSVRESLKVVELLGGIDTTLALFVGVNNALGVRPLLKYGSEALKNKWLPVLAAGRELAAFAITEPGAGANPQKIISIADWVGQEKWKLNGKKIWSGNAAWAGLIHVFAREKDALGNSKGISAFALTQGTPGLQMGPESLTMGVRGMVQNSVCLTDAEVEADCLLHHSGGGMEVAQDAMVRARLGIGAIAIGVMKRCAQLMVRYASGREIAQGTLLEDPVSRQRLSDLTAAITASESLVYRIADLLDHGQEVPHDLFSVCKIMVPELAWEAVDHLVQMLGGRGYEEPNIAPRLMRDVRLLRIFEGPTEALRAYVGAKVCASDHMLMRFLDEAWQCADIAECLEEAVDTLVQDNPNVQDVHQSCGALAAWATFWAAIEDGSDELLRAGEWAKSKFEACLAQAQQKGNTTLTVQDIESVVQAYDEELGTEEQTAPGVQTQIDPLLKGDHAFLPEVVDMPIKTDATHIDQKDPQVVQLTDWIIAQLRQIPQVNVDRIQPQSELMDLGVDSLIAIQLIDKLEGHLKMEIDPAIIWRFPTLWTLAEELIKQQGKQDWALMDATQNEGKFDEIVDLLQNEIDLSRAYLEGK